MEEIQDKRMIYLLRCLLACSFCVHGAGQAGLELERIGESETHAGFVASAWSAPLIPWLMDRHAGGSYGCGTCLRENGDCVF